MIMRQRHRMFDRLLEFMLRYTSMNLGELLFENKKQFRDTFLHEKNGP